MYWESSSKCLAIKNVEGSIAESWRLWAKLGVKGFASLFILLFMGEAAQDIRAMEGGIEGSTEAQSLQGHLWLQTEVILEE